ncbi:hypothetical protein ACO2Q8_02245 [Larkinella sp. VNQ87]|uniref:hypothetical protein n=1 Tax=Larkinella sp. VNQ87 TaxID=3400921 RepID=UPI003C1166E0
MKAQKKALAESIAQSVETKLAEGGNASKKLKKLVQQSSEKLAAKLIKVTTKEEKKQPKAEKTEKK